MILDLDCGNTRVKWRIVNGDDLKDRGACSSATDEWLPRALESGVKRVRVSIVTGADERERIKRLCQAELGIDAEFAFSKAFECGIRNGYEQPERLGVDRWLAVIAAYRETGGEACCVVDCGSAITVDYVSADGVHKGGVIAPGIRLMRKALLQETREVRVGDTAHSANPDQKVLPAPLGKNTETAVSLGLEFMEAGLIEIALRRYECMFQEQATLILTGGDAPLIQKLVEPRALVVADLVLDGLQWVLP